MQTALISTAHKAISMLAEAHVGVIRRFGTDGVLYEVLRVMDAQTVMIRVLTTGEETTYPIAHVLTDPQQ
jgi:hypothetical protein